MGYPQRRIILTERQSKAIAAQDQVGGKVRAGLIPYGVCECGNIDENTLSEILPDDVDLSSFTIRKELNPEIWDGFRMKPEVRARLLEIAKDFCEFAGIDFGDESDIIVTGSIANYDWSRDFSDVDLHILYNFELAGRDTSMLKDFFNLKKNDWNRKHDDLSIYGFKVELYVQDENEEHTSSGVYSISRDKWITKPDRDNLAASTVSKDYIRQKASWYTQKIEDLCKIFNSGCDDKHHIEKALSASEKLFDAIKKERSSALSDGKNEISNGNIIFKYLRRMGYIEKLSNLKDECYDILKSI